VVVDPDFRVPEQNAPRLSLGARGPSRDRRATRSLRDRAVNEHGELGVARRISASATPFKLHQEIAETRGGRPLLERADRESS